MARTFNMTSKSSSNLIPIIMSFVKNIDCHQFLHFLLLRCQIRRKILNGVVFWENKFRKNVENDKLISNTFRYGSHLLKSRLSV